MKVFIFILKIILFSIVYLLVFSDWLRISEGFFQRHSNNFYLIRDLILAVLVVVGIYFIPPRATGKWKYVLLFYSVIPLLIIADLTIFFCI